MSNRVITVIVKDDKGYVKKGVKVKSDEKDSETLTNESGEAYIVATGAKVAIYVKGTTKYDSWTSECPNPLIVEV